MLGTSTNDNERKISPLSFILVGLLVSAMLGITLSQLYIDKPISYRESILMKQTIIIFSAATIYALVSGFISYFPVKANLFKALAISVILSTPYFAALVLTNAVPIYAVLSILPAQMMLVAVIFIWLAADEIYPEIGKHKIKHLLIIVVLAFVAMFITPSNMPDIVARPLSLLGGLFYLLWLLIRGKRELKNTIELQDDKR